MSRVYKKPSISIQEQIEKLQVRGLIINNKELIENKLKFIGYYHLSAYFKSFQNMRNNVFHKNISFEQVLSLYVFDRKLKADFFDAIERIEISLKSLLTNEISEITKNPYWFSDSKNFIKKFDHSQFIARLEKHINKMKTKDGVVKEFYRKYPHHEGFPPSWILMEILYFGDSIQIFKNLQRQFRQQVALHYKFDEKIISSWLVMLNDIRNICAHHGRLWNRDIKKITIPSNTNFIQGNGKILSAINIIAIFLRVLSPQSELIKNIIQQMKESHLNLIEMGCSESWEINLLNIFTKKND